MRIPLLLVTYLPKAWQEKYMQHRWDVKTDQEILIAYFNATDWIDISMGSDTWEATFGTLVDIAQSCFERLELYILPQMRKRKLL